MKTTLILFCLVFASCLTCLSQSGNVYRQEVRRDDVNIFRALKGTKGTLTLDFDSILFETHGKTKRINFSLSYNDVVEIKRYKAMLLPNRIGIRTSGGETYRIFTYRRKKIIDFIEARISARNDL